MEISHQLRQPMTQRVLGDDLPEADLGAKLKGLADMPGKLRPINHHLRIKGCGINLGGAGFPISTESYGG